MICVPTLCTTECAGWRTGHSFSGPRSRAVTRFRRQLFVNTLAGVPVLLHPRMGPTPEHLIHRPGGSVRDWGTGRFNRVREARFRAKFSAASRRIGPLT